VKPYRPKRIVVEREALGDEVARRVMEAYRGVRLEVVERAEELLAEPPEGPDPIGAGKQTLLLARFRGAFVKPCPGTAEMLCCQYVVVSPIVNCPLECTYCVLQGYLNRPAITVYTNVDDCLEAIDALAKTSDQSLIRLGTGELADSLALEEATGWARRLVEFVASRPGLVLELKTKTSCVEPLLGLGHRGRTVVAWSLNPQAVIRREELKTASLEERLAAASRIQAEGYPVAFHFDPIILYKGWREDYRDLVERLSERIDPGGVAWVSLGGLRFPPGLKPIIKSRFSKSRLLAGEFVACEDGKLRYLMPQRASIYRALVGWLGEWDPEILVYLCMERALIWEAVLGERPPDREAVERRFLARLEAVARWAEAKL
jgi:spore photoproduct lyase